MILLAKEYGGMYSKIFLNHRWKQVRHPYLLMSYTSNHPHEHLARLSIIPANHSYCPLIPTNTAALSAAVLQPQKVLVVHFAVQHAVRARRISFKASTDLVPTFGGFKSIVSCQYDERHFDFVKI